MKITVKIILVTMLALILSNLNAISQIHNVVESVKYDYETEMYTAYFGYYNPNSYSVTISTGNDNNFVSHSEYNYLLPTEFLPGRHVNTSIVSWPGDGALVWKLRTPGGSPAGYATATAALSIPFHDDDDDGVINNDDDYPIDSDRAYDIYTPGENIWGTLAYEDLWPNKGDFDLNDMVIDYNFHLVIDATNSIKDINAMFRLRAVGASFNNGFAIEFPFPNSAIEVHTGTAQGSSYDMERYASGDRAVIRVIQNTTDFGITTNSGVFWNTQMDQPKYPDADIAFTMTLSNPVSLASLPYLAPFNPFLLVGGQFGKEVHLADMPPTADVNPAYFGEGDDTSDPSTGRYYKTASNLPWAINLPISWTYPIERQQVTSGYLALKPWAESGGTAYPDWYNLSPSSQVDLDYLYTK
jgi:LruC domain-containing protein